VNRSEAAESVPPPADDEEDYSFHESTAEDAPTAPDPAAVAEALEPPVTPVVEMPGRVANGESRAIDDDDSAQATAGAVDELIAPVNEFIRMLIVEIRPSGNWKEACRQSIGLAKRYDGNAMLRLRLAGQDLVMDFPNHRTACELELIEALERLPGVGRVFER